MRDVFGTRLELRLGDPVDSEIDRKVAALVPTGRPGRGLVPGKLHFLGALPRIDGDPDPSTVGDGVDDLVKRSDAAWHGPRRPEAAAAARADHPRRRSATPGRGRRPLRERLLLLGVDEKELAPVGLDMDAEPHLLVFGDGQSGKSALLRGLIREIIRTRTRQAGPARRASTTGARCSARCPRSTSSTT